MSATFLPDFYSRSVTHGRWRDDLERVLAQLEPWVVATADGERYIGHSAPGPLVRLYEGLCSVGFEHGWFRFDTDEEV